MFQRIAPRGTAAAAVLTCIALAACADGASAPLLETTEYRLSSAKTYQRVMRLRIGDKLRITVFGEKDLSGDFEINAAGQVALPLLGDQQADGLLVSEFRDALTRRLARGYLKNPRVTVEAMNLRPVYVHGEVRSGGVFPYRPGLRLRDAVALAGGFTHQAIQDYVLVVRHGKEGEYRAPLNSNIELLPGDNIRIPERLY